jgi:DNA primase
MSGKIKRHTIDTIFETARIEEVIGDFVNLKKAGSNYKALSPFTNEKTPSFVVSPAKQIFKCFSSGKGGNVVTFLMEQDHMTYPEALRYLANKYDIEIEEDEVDSPEEKMILNERQNLEVVNKFALEFFVDKLKNSEEGRSIGLSYFKERGFRDDTIDAFQLGYSPEKSNALYETGKAGAYSLEYLEKGGLIKKSGDRYYDFFRGRVIFPILSLTGKPIAFGARTLKKDTKTAKYFNSPETALYNKSRVLYGLYQARATIVKEDNCFLVEGYTDVISLHQAGIKNTVASAGTSLTPDQVRLIKRYSQNITILYDGDPAGIKASFRGIDIILDAGLNVKVVLFPEGQDPDSFARSVDADTLKTFLEKEAVDFIKFKTKILKEDAGDDPVKNAGLVRQILDSIARVNDTILRSFYIRESAQMLNVEETNLINELNKILRKKRARDIGQPLPEQIPPPEAVPKQKQLEFNTNQIESDILTKLLQYGNQVIEIELIDEENKKSDVETTVVDYILLEIENDIFDFVNVDYKNLYQQFKSLDLENTPALQGYFLNHQNDDIRKLTTDILISPYELSSNWKDKHHILTEMEDSSPQSLRDSVERTIVAFKLRNVELLILQKQHELLVDENKSAENYEPILNEIKNLDKAKSLFSDKLTRVILK